MPAAAEADIAEAAVAAVPVAVEADIAAVPAAVPAAPVVGKRSRNRGKRPYCRHTPDDIFHKS